MVDPMASNLCVTLFAFAVYALIISFALPDEDD